MDYYRRGSTSPLTPRVRSERIGSRSSMRSRGGRVPTPSGWKRFFNRKWILLSLLTAFLLTIGTVVTIMVTAETYDLEEIDNLKFSTTVVTEDGKEIGRIGPENRERVTLKQLEKYNKNLPITIVKVEDERFYDHIGVDFWGLGRAFVKNIIKGGKAEGASTITMQVAGNVVLKDRTKTYTRKIREIGAALGLEMKYEKDKILETYLNFVNLGNNAMGVKSAAKIYFGKDVTKESLEPHEIALIAGLPKAPNGYNPYGDEENIEAAKTRRNVVLMKMAEQTGDIPPVITQAEKVKYQKMGLGVKKEYLEKYGTKQRYAAYLNTVKKEVEARYGITASELETQGYKVVVGIDPVLQESVEKVLKDEGNELFVDEDGNPLKLVDAAVTIVDPKTGLIRAVGGGREYKPGYINWSLRKMQPGSSIKPLTVYTPAVQEHGYHENKIVNDTKPKIEGWNPQNYDKKEHGQVPMVEMVRNSYNLSTINLLKDVVTLPEAYKWATEKFKLPLVEDDEVYAALALGGLTNGVSTRDMAQAYTAFPNNGEIVTAHAVIKVFNRNGQEETPKDGQEIDQKGNADRIFSEQTAWYMTRMLKAVVTDGTGKKAQLSDGRDVAGKTGTTQNHESVWFCGYTPDMVGAVSVFKLRDKNGKTTDVELKSSIPASVFREIFEEYYAKTNKPVEHFQKPPNAQDPPELFNPNEFNFTADYNEKKQEVELRWSKVDGARFKLEYTEDGINWTPLFENEDRHSYEHSVQPPEPNVLEQITGGGGKTIKFRLTVILPDQTYGPFEKEVTIPAKESTDDKEHPGKHPGEEPPGNENPYGLTPDQMREAEKEWCQERPFRPECQDLDGDSYPDGPTFPDEVYERYKRKHNLD